MTEDTILHKFQHEIISHSWGSNIQSILQNSQTRDHDDGNDVHIY